MKKNTKTFIYVLLAIAFAIYFGKVIFPEFAAGFREGYNEAQKKRNKEIK